MGSEKKEKPNEGTPFDDLASEIEKDLEPVDLQSKVLEFQAKRNSKREPLNGSVIIYDLREKILSKADFKNLSHDGVSFEISPAKVKENDDVFVHFDSALKLGMVLCTVQWVRDIEGHRKNHRILGLRFKKLTPLKLKILNEYLAKLQHSRDHDPFYGA